MYLRDTVVVLKRTPYREHDARIVLFGQTHGKLEAVAHGCFKSSAKQSGHLEPFSQAEVMIAKGKGWDKLAVAKLITSGSGVRSRLSMLAIAGAFCDLVDRLTRQGVADQMIYELLLEVLALCQVTDSEPSADRARLLLAAASLKLLDLLGYAVHLERCLSCDNILFEPASFVSDSGGFICGSCAVEHRREYPQAVRLPDHVLPMLKFMRLRPLKELFNLTGSVECFAWSSSVVEQALRHTPLIKEPHGWRTVGALLGG